MVTDQQQMDQVPLVLVTSYRLVVRTGQSTWLSERIQHDGLGFGYQRDKVPLACPLALPNTTHLKVWRGEEEKKESEDMLLMSEVTA